MKRLTFKFIIGSTVLVLLGTLIKANKKNNTSQYAYFKTTSGACNGQITAIGGTFSNSGVLVAVIHANPNNAPIILYTSNTCKNSAYFSNF